MSLPRQVPHCDSHSGLSALLESSQRVPLIVGKQAEFFVYFAQNILPLLEGYRSKLDPMYCSNNGRPAYDPVRLLAVLVLQFVMRVPDREAANSLQYDMRWRLAVGLSEGEAACDPSLLSIFRNRLVDSGQESLAFTAVLDYLVQQGWIPKRSRQRLDSTHVWGVLSQMSRVECVRQTLRIFLEALEKQELLPPSWSLFWERYVESKIDPRAGVPTLKAKMAEAGEDMLSIWREVMDQWPLASLDEFILFQRVFLENYQIDPAQSLQQTRAQPTGAVHNPHEPQAQWSSKSTTKDKNWVGYKVQIAETVQSEPCQSTEPTSNFLTAIVTQDAPASDKAGLVEVFDQQQSMGLDKPESLYVDGAYVSSEALHQAQLEERQLRGPAPASPDRGKVYTVEAFAIEIEQRQAICPSGQHASNVSRLEAKKTGKVEYRFEWTNTVCGACSLRDQCVSAGQTHRTVVVGEHHSLLQARRLEMKTEAFKKEMQQRNGIEGTQSELVRGYGLRHARYRGKAKVRLQNYLIGAACNIKRLFRRIQWEAKQLCFAQGQLDGAVEN